MYFYGMSNVIVRSCRSGLFCYAVILLFFCGSCKYKNPSEVKRVSFKNVTGINYIEVKRRFPNGLSINENGYELTPSWKLSFYSNDWARVFSPDSGRFLSFRITHDHDSLFYIARAWFRAQKITKDSLVFQVMNVKSNVIYLDRSSVFLTFYSDKYIKNVLHTVPGALMGKTRQDTLFIQKRSAQVNAHPDSAFAAREPVVFVSRTPLAKAEKVKVEANVMNNYDNSDNYTSPEFKMTIYNAYKDFNYEILALVDHKGGIHFKRSMWALSMDDATSNEKTIAAILNGYVKTYFNITPGKTLGIPHNSLVILNLSGKKSKN